MSHFHSPSLRAALDGISGILVTPFDADDAIVAAPLRPIVDRAVDAGVHVLVANGNTSEFYGLRADEAERMVGIAAECVAGRVPLLAGVGRSVHEACALARASRTAGARVRLALRVRAARLGRLLRGFRGRWGCADIDLLRMCAPRP